MSGLELPSITFCNFISKLPIRTYLLNPYPVCTKISPETLFNLSSLLKFYNFSLFILWYFSVHRKTSGVNWTIRGVGRRPALLIPRIGLAYKYASLILTIPLVTPWPPGGLGSLIVDGSLLLSIHTPHYYRFIGGHPNKKRKNGGHPKKRNNGGHPKKKGKTQSCLNSCSVLGQAIW